MEPGESLIAKRCGGICALKIVVPGGAYGRVKFGNVHIIQDVKAVPGLHKKAKAVPQGLFSGKLRGKAAVVLTVLRHGIFSALLEHRPWDAAACIVPVHGGFVSAFPGQEPQVTGGSEGLNIAVLAGEDGVFPKVQRVEGVLPMSPVSSKAKARGKAPAAGFSAAAGGNCPKRAASELKPHFPAVREGGPQVQG